VSATTVPAAGSAVTLAGVTPLDPRSLVRDGLTERFVVLVDGSRAAAADVRELVALDTAAGVRTHLVDASWTLPALDDADALRAAAEADVLPEPLAASAPIARALAPATCTAGCAGYHGAVQELRLLGVVGSPQINRAFYREELGAAAARGARRVLVAGAADYAMLAHVLDAMPVAAVTVIDRCPTPLLLSRWYGAMHGAAVATAVADVARYVADPAPDVIVTDSLLTLLDPAGRLETLRRWRDSLAPDGVAITSLRLSPAGPPAAPPAAAVDAFTAWVLDAARRRAGLLELDPERLESAARAYTAIPLRSWPVRDTRELRALVADAGLAIERLSVRQAVQRGPAGVSGPGANPGATYARVVLRRP
jgi:hypothetical protein